MVGGDRPASLGLAVCLPVDGPRHDAQTVSRPLVAVVVAILATGDQRDPFPDPAPPVYVLVFSILTFRACRKQHRRGRLVRLPASPILHGDSGELARRLCGLPVIVATAAARARDLGAWDRAAPANLAKFGLVFLASVWRRWLNPYGVGSVPARGNLLVSSGVTSLIYRVSAGSVRQAGGRCVLEWVLLALVGLPVVSSRRVESTSWSRAGLAAPGLTSIRNAPAFCPGGRTGPCAGSMGCPSRPEGVEAATADRSGRPGGGGPLSLACGVRLGGSAQRMAVRGTGQSINSPPARIFHEQDWGGLIEAECSRRVGRISTTGSRSSAGRIVEYLQTLFGGPVWDTVRDRDQIDLVWLRPTAVSPSGCSRNRGGPSFIAIPSRCSSGGSQETPPDRGLLLRLGLELFPHCTSAHRAGGPSTGWAGLSWPRTWSHHASTSRRHGYPQEDCSGSPEGLGARSGSQGLREARTETKLAQSWNRARQEPPARTVRRGNPRRALSGSQNSLSFWSRWVPGNDWTGLGSTARSTPARWPAPFPPGRVANRRGRRWGRAAPRFWDRRWSSRLSRPAEH